MEHKIMKSIAYVVMLASALAVLPPLIAPARDASQFGLLLGSLDHLTGCICFTVAAAGLLISARPEKP
jgi:hypothetical protein